MSTPSPLTNELQTLADYINSEAKRLSEAYGKPAMLILQIIQHMPQKKKVTHAK